MANKSTNGLRGITERDGTITLVWNMQVAKLLSPDGKLHCLPCEVCGGIQWVGLDVVSIVCDECAATSQVLPEELKTGDTFWTGHNEWRIEFFDCRPSADVSRDRGTDRDGNARAVGARRVSDGTLQMFSDVELSRGRIKG